MSDRDALRDAIAAEMQTVDYSASTYTEKSERLLATLEAAGVRLVPSEATEGMANLAIDGTHEAGYPKPTRTQMTVAYRWMIAASPYAPEANAGEGE